VLSGILLSAEGGTITLAATDMELSLRTTLEAQVDGDGAVVIPGKPLVELARLLPENEVTIEYRPAEGTVQIVSGSYSSRLNVFNAEDFPRLPAIDAQLHSIEREALLETVERVAKSASRDESRPVLTGILVRFEGGKLVMVATDSYRLSVKETDLGEAAPELEAIIPARALTELTRLAGGETVELGVHENHVVFGTGSGDKADVWLTTRRIDGQFPNYRQLLPDAFEVELTLPKAELADVVRRASVLALRNSPLRLRLAEGELTISAQTQDVGETHETMPAAYSGEEFLIGFNAEFLRDGVDSIVGDDVKVKLINPLRPAILQDAAGDFTYLIMPIRLAG
jgi:DNA polymerase-3 subunit beta